MQNKLSTVAYMPITSAYICETCQIVSNCSEACPTCANATHLVALAGLVQPIAQPQPQTESALKDKAVEATNTAEAPEAVKEKGIE